MSSHPRSDEAAKEPNVPPHVSHRTVIVCLGGTRPPPRNPHPKSPPRWGGVQGVVWVPTPIVGSKDEALQMTLRSTCSAVLYTTTAINDSVCAVTHHYRLLLRRLALLFTVFFFDADADKTSWTSSSVSMPNAADPFEATSRSKPSQQTWERRRRWSRW